MENMSNKSVGVRVFGGGGYNEHEQRTYTEIKTHTAVLTPLWLSLLYILGEPFAFCR